MNHENYYVETSKVIIREMQIFLVHMLFNFFKFSVISINYIFVFICCNVVSRGRNVPLFQCHEMNCELCLIVIVYANCTSGSAADRSVSRVR